MPLQTIFLMSFARFWMFEFLVSLMETILFAYTSKMTKREDFFVKKQIFSRRVKITNLELDKELLFDKLS